MLLKRSLAALTLFCSTLITVRAIAQRGMGYMHAPGGIALSPDATTVAWTLRSRDGSTLHLTSVSSSTDDKTIAIPNATGCAYSSPIWSPDDATLAFLAACAPASADPTVPRQSQIYLWSKSTGDVRQLTHLTGDINQPAWSPDGKSIAFLFVENATRTAGALDAMKPWSGVIGEDGVEVQRVSAVDVATGNDNFVTPANLHVYEFDWSPSSRNIAFIAANPPGENNWWVAKLYSVDFTRNISQTNGNTHDRVNEELHTVFDPGTTHSALHGLQIAVPRWSPDGSRIAFIGGLMSDQGSTGGDVWTIASSGKGEPTDITPNIDGTPCFETWITDHELGFVEDRSGHTRLVDWNPDTKKEIGSTDLGEVYLSGGEIKDAISVAGRSGSSQEPVAAFVLRSPNKPAEIYIQTGAYAPQQLTHLNDAVQLHPPRFESIEWENEGFHVQGWLTFPKDYDASKTYPLIVEVHGGPSSSAGPPSTASDMWSQHGYFVLNPNPRGSFGQGEKFVQANRKDFGYGDLRDILKGMDTVEAKYPIDKSREGITGWSYGGFMTMFAVTQTHRFRAAVAGAGLSDWLSYYGENSIDQWMIPFFGASVYDDPAVYAKSSAITYIKNVKTPTLVIVGDRDGECPAPQSFEFWHALRDLGVKTELVVYPDEGHGFRNPAHIADRNERMIKWFADNMPAPSSSNTQTAQK
ncbi:MAG TPA: S9 family peptidase [Acidobacteriaceae bacterium]|nr:S9 family peptidase [Acidobacteriaceae bacterium]